MRCSHGIPTGCTYIGFELPDKIDKVRRDVYKDSRANISECKATLQPVHDKLLRRGKRETAHPSVH